MLWLSVHFPLLPLEVYQCSSNSAIAIVEQQRILLCNPQAIASGIEPNLTVSTALALCHDLQLLERQLDAEQQKIEQLALVSYQFSSQVALYKTRSQQHSLLIEIGSSEKLFSSIDNVKCALSEQLNALLNYPIYQYAIAPTAKAAEVLARALYAKQQAKQQAKQKTQQHKVQQRVAKNSVEYVSLDFLDLPTKTLEQFHNLGIHQVNDILALPSNTIGKRFGKDVINYLKQLSGQRLEPLNFFSPANSFKQELFYVHGLRTHQDILNPIKKLSEDFSYYLWQTQQQCLAFEWQFTRFSKQKNTIALSLSAGLHKAEDFFSLTELRLKEIPLDSPIESIQLSCNNFERIEYQSISLFNVSEEDNNAPSIEGFYHLVDRLKSKLGESCLQQVLHSDEFIPELANQVKQQVPIKKHKSMTSVDIHQKQHSLEKPIWLLKQPVPLSSHRKLLYYQQRPLTIVKGPERIESNWWNTPCSRDYFIASFLQPEISNVKKTSTQGGSYTPNKHHGFYWIFYERQKKQWFLQGVYS